MGLPEVEVAGTHGSLPRYPKLAPTIASLFIVETVRKNQTCSALSSGTALGSSPFQ
jgi:hypothetical protein